MEGAREHSERSVASASSPPRTGLPGRWGSGHHERLEACCQAGHLEKPWARPKYHHSMVGGNFRLDAIQAAVLLVKLPHLDSWTRQRQSNAARYRRLFTEAELAARVDRCDAGLEEAPVVIPYEAPNRRHIYNQFVLRVRERDALCSYLHRTTSAVRSTIQSRYIFSSASRTWATGRVISLALSERLWRPSPYRYNLS
jgi:dTDP-4-amino-4,6-dideoxygalactose transaminase